MRYLQLFSSILLFVFHVGVANALYENHEFPSRPMNVSDISATLDRPRELGSSSQDSSGTMKRDSTTNATTKKTKKKDKKAKAKAKKAGKSSKSNKSAKKSKSSSSPGNKDGFSQESDFEVHLFGLTDIMDPKEVNWFEKQTSFYIENFYLENFSSKFGKKVSKVNADVKVTNQIKSGTNLMNRRMEEEWLSVFFTASMSYQVSDPNVDHNDLMSAPFDSKKLRKRFMTDYLKAEDMFSELNGVSGLMLTAGDQPTPTLEPSPVPTATPSQKMLPTTLIPTYLPTDFPTTFPPTITPNPTTKIPTYSPTNLPPTYSPTTTRKPTELQEPTPSPSWSPTKDLSEEGEEIITITSHLVLTQNGIDISDADEVDLEEVTLRFLFDNVGGPNKYTPLEVNILEKAYDEDKRVALKLKTKFSVKNSFVSNYERRRGLKVDNKCNSKDKIECCLNGAINKNADSEHCDSIGCSEDEDCQKKPPKNIKARMRRWLEDEDDLFDVDFVVAVKNNSELDPTKAESVLGAKSTEKVAKCSGISMSDFAICCFSSVINGSLGNKSCSKFLSNKCSKNMDKKCGRKDKK